MEIAGRAGGLIPTTKIALRDLVLRGDYDLDALGGSSLERSPTVAEDLWAVSTVNPGDVFVIASNSGVNGSIVGLALLAKQHGHPVIAVTSLQHTMAVPAQAPQRAAAVRRGRRGPGQPGPVRRRDAGAPCDRLRRASPYRSGRSPRSPARTSPSCSPSALPSGSPRPAPSPRSTCRPTSPAATSTTRGSKRSTRAGSDAVPSVRTPDLIRTTQHTPNTTSHHGNREAQPHDQQRQAVRTARLPPRLARGGGPHPGQRLPGLLRHLGHRRQPRRGSAVVRPGRRLRHQPVRHGGRTRRWTP